VASGIKDLFLDGRVDHQLFADLLRELALTVLVIGFVELLEKLLDLSVVLLQELDGALDGDCPAICCADCWLPCLSARFAWN
jgi:hypothetical protein